MKFKEGNGIKITGCIYVLLITFFLGYWLAGDHQRNVQPINNIKPSRSSSAPSVNNVKKGARKTRYNEYNKALYNEACVKLALKKLRAKSPVYMARARCKNCGRRLDVLIPKGVVKESFLSNFVCPVCRCKSGFTTNYSVW